MPCHRPWAHGPARLADLVARAGHASTVAAMSYQHTARKRDERIADGLSGQIKKAAIGHGKHKK